MNQFLKMTLASILGIIVSGIIFILFLIILFASMSKAVPQNPYYISEKNSILHLRLEGEITERTSEYSFSPLLGYSEPATGLDNILKSIRIAKSDKNIIGIYLDLNGIKTGYASIEEIRSQLSQFKKSGKFVIAYADSYQQKDYYLATIADSLFLNPSGMLDFRGLSSNHIFYKNALEKLGVEVQVFRVGTFKSAVEPFIAEEMSKANKEQTEDYLNSMWETVLKQVSRSRTIPVKKLNVYADTMLMLSDPTQYTRLKLVDRLLYRHDVERRLAALSYKKKVSQIKLVKIADLCTTLKTNSGSKRKIALVYASGEIDNGGSEINEGINTKKLVETLYTLKADRNIKAVVMRVNSPGGSAFGSEQVWAAIEDLKKSKPVAVSMGDYAASGGYYISCNASRIFAQPTTLTGSIGIFGLVPNAQKLLSDKLGLTFDEVRTNRYGNFPSLEKPMTTDEKALMQGYVERGYSLFVKRCAEGRQMTTEDLSKIAEGRVWTGAEAVKLGLVDELGNMNKAIRWAAKTAELENFEVEEYPLRKSFIEELFTGLNQEIRANAIKSVLGHEAAYYQTIQSVREMDPIQARMDRLELY